MRDIRRHRVLVTGGAGFLGSHLCARLIVAGRDVSCVNNFDIGIKGNVVHLLDHTRFCCGTISRTRSTSDQIFNLACPASPIHYQFDPVQTSKTRVHDAINMLALGKRTRPRTLQTSGAHQSRAYLQYIRTTDASGSRPGRLKLHQATLKGQSIQIHGDGSQTQCFCYVDDMIQPSHDADGRDGRPHRTGQSRKWQRSHDSGACSAGDRAHQLELADYTPRGPSRRPPAPSAGRDAVALEIRMVREDLARCGFATHPGYFEAQLSDCELRHRTGAIVLLGAAALMALRAVWRLSVGWGSSASGDKLAAPPTL